MIEMMNVSKKYGKGILAVNNLSVRIQDGEFVYVVGPSGAGKSTVLNILGGMDTNDEGEVWIDGVNISNFDETQLTYYRRDDV